jgi:hypothetical protein
LNQDEKKSESDIAHKKLANEIAVMFRQSYEHDAENGEKEVEKLSKSIKHWEDEEKKTTDKHQKELILTHIRFLQLQVAIRYDEITMRMGFAILASVVAGVDFDIEAKKKQFDSHLAKRVGQLFGDKDDLGYVA